VTRSRYRAFRGPGGGDSDAFRAARRLSESVPFEPFKLDEQSESTPSRARNIAGGRPPPTRTGILPGGLKLGGDFKFRVSAATDPSRSESPLIRVGSDSESDGP
jgi:hypothetical protein